MVPGLPPESVGLVGSWDYVASLFVIGDAVDAEILETPRYRVLAVILDERPSLVLGGVSTPAAPGLAVKLVARSAPELTVTLQEAIWAAIRKDYGVFRLRIFGNTEPAQFLVRSYLIPSRHV